MAAYCDCVSLGSPARAGRPGKLDHNVVAAARSRPEGLHASQVDQPASVAGLEAFAGNCRDPWTHSSGAARAFLEDLRARLDAVPNQAEVVAITFSSACPPP